MTRILYWNINNFSLPKIQITAPPLAAAEAAQRLNFLAYLMGGPVGGPPPDVIIVVEVYSRVREVGLEGSVLNSGRTAGAGVLRLLTSIRAILGNQWCVVPPLNLGELGQREAVAVFYDSTNLQFTGPNLFYDRWPGTGIGQAQPVTAATFGNIINYPAAWMNALPNPGNPIPALQLNRTHPFMIGGVATAVNEWQLAGQWEYYTTPPPRPIPSPIQPPYPGNRIMFPNAGCRAPFWTQFSDLTFMGGRLINLFTVHTSPSTARQAVLQMQNVAEMAAVAAGEVNVVLGDFNVDAFGANAGAYNWMINGIYTMELDPRVAHAGAVVPARKPYCMTHLLPTASAWPFNNVGVATDPQHNVYPRFGYMGSSFPAINDSGAIDNFFTAYGGGGTGGPAVNITVINTIVGTPYNALAAAPVGVTAELTGGLPYLPTLTNAMPVPNMANPTGGVAPPVDTINFQAWQNFGGIHSTSDHLPVMIDI
jgi:hypothetical protein